MTDFSRLLKEAAGQPPRPLDMAAVRLRAARMGAMRRGGVWLCAVLAVLGIGVPTGMSLAPSGDQPADVRTIDVDHDTRNPLIRGDEAEPKNSEATEPDVDPSSARVGGRVAPTSTTAVVTTSTTGPSTGCSRVGPVAADCGEKDATTCWAARVSCPTTTTTATRPSG